MIKANELRIGNHLYWKGEGICKIISLSQYGFKVVTPKGKHPDQDEYDQIDPIVLTPEWLERCGFKFVKEEGYFIYKLQKKSQGIDSIKVGSGVFLHQLQNLYFALTGEELKINL